MATDLKMFLLTADNLVRCHWDGRSRHVDGAGSGVGGRGAAGGGPGRWGPQPAVCRHQHGDARERGRRGELEVDSLRRPRLPRYLDHAASSHAVRGGLRGNAAGGGVRERGRRTVVPRAYGLSEARGLRSLDVSTAAAYSAHPLHRARRPGAGRDRRGRGGRGCGAKPRPGRDLGGHQRSGERRGLSGVQRSVREAALPDGCPRGRPRLS